MRAFKRISDQARFELWRLRDSLRDRLQGRGHRQRVFAGIYSQNLWGHAESVSGAGSSLTATERARRELPAIWQQYQVRSLLDAPCGDFQQSNDSEQSLNVPHAHPVLLSNAVTPTLGASKVYLEAAEGFRRAGWEVIVIGPEEVAGGPPGDVFTQPPRLREYLRRHASGFDVVEYEHQQLPFPRSDFPSRSAVRRPVGALGPHRGLDSNPPRPGLRSRVGRLLKGWWERRRCSRCPTGQPHARGRRLDQRLQHDRAGHPGRARPPGGQDLYVSVRPVPRAAGRLPVGPTCLPDPPAVGFVGTFDPRKGMCEFPALVDRVVRRIPGVTFRLLGTAGMEPDADGVRGYFPRRLWPRLEIYPRYDPNELPHLLAGVSVGVFPSRVESFGFGVLEMLAGAVPVIAYDAPGPNVMLLPEYLVPVGADRELADRVCGTLSRLRPAAGGPPLGTRPGGVVRLGAGGHGTRSVYLDKQAGWSTRAAARPSMIAQADYSIHSSHSSDGPVACPRSPAQRYPASSPQRRHPPGGRLTLE